VPPVPNLQSRNAAGFLGTGCENPTRALPVPFGLTRAYRKKSSGSACPWLGTGSHTFNPCLPCAFWPNPCLPAKSSFSPVFSGKFASEVFWGRFWKPNL